MNRMDARKGFLFLVLIVLLAYPSLAFCEAGYFRASPEAKGRAEVMKTLAILFVDMKVYQLTEGGPVAPGRKLLNN